MRPLSAVASFTEGRGEVKSKLQARYVESIKLLFEGGAESHAEAVGGTNRGESI